MTTTVYIAIPGHDLEGGAQSMHLVFQINGILDEHGYGPATIEQINDDFFAVTVADDNAAFVLRMFVSVPVNSSLPASAARSIVRSREDYLSSTQRERLKEAREARERAFSAGTVPYPVPGGSI